MMAAAPQTASSAAEPAQRAIKRTYSSMWTGEDLDEDYGNSTQGPPKDRRAGAEIAQLPSIASGCAAAVRIWCAMP